MRTCAIGIIAVLLAWSVSIAAANRRCISVALADSSSALVRERSVNFRTDSS